MNTAHASAWPVNIGEAARVVAGDAAFVGGFVHQGPQRIGVAGDEHTPLLDALDLGDPIQLHARRDADAGVLTTTAGKLGEALQGFLKADALSDPAFAAQVLRLPAPADIAFTRDALSP